MGLIPDLLTKFTEDDTIPDNMSLLEIGEAHVRGKLKLRPDQRTTLYELLQYFYPKRQAVAVATFEGGFGAQLDRAIERSAGMKLIEAKPIDPSQSEPVRTEHSGDEMKGPFTKLERY